MTIRDELLLPWPRTETAVQRELADYYASIGHLDEQIGRILATLRRLGLEENTLVVFSSDNGLALGSHGLMGKQNLYEHSVRVPLLIAGPGVPGSLRSESLCYLQDVFPTLADLAGVAPIRRHGRAQPAPAARRSRRPLPRHDLHRLSTRPARDSRQPLQADPLPASGPDPVVRPAGRSPGARGSRLRARTSRRPLRG